MSPNSVNISRASDSFQCFGSWPTNIFMESGSGCRALVDVDWV